MSAGRIDWNSLGAICTLNIDWHTKYIALLVFIKSEAYPAGQQSVLLATKQGFDNDQALIQFLKSRPSNGDQIAENGTDTNKSLQEYKIFPKQIRLLDANDIYYRFIVSCGDLSVCKLTLIHPATSAHISKYTQQSRSFFAETPSVYKNIVHPYIHKQSEARIKWIENAINGHSEQDKLIYADRDSRDGFLLFPDSKWDQTSMSSLYLLALTIGRDIKSLRDLTSEHLPLLKNIKLCIEREVPQKYPGVSAHQLRMYIHYLPTYYYFHVHVVHIDLESIGCSVGMAHLLDDVIDNIENISSDYYQRRTLYYTLGEQHDLYLLMRRGEDEQEK